MTPRRELASAVLVDLAGAGLALFAATRTWAVEVTARPAPLPPVRTAETGGAVLSALGVVALAGAGALLATRGRGRTVVGVLLAGIGLGIVAGAVPGLPAGWPALCAAGGLAVAAAGAFAVARGHGWPHMGTRYERAASRTDPDRDLWEALDRGEDPTKDG